MLSVYEAADMAHCMHALMRAHTKILAACKPARMPCTSRLQELCVHSWIHICVRSTFKCAHVQLKTSEEDVKRLISERRALQAKFADVEVVEGSLRELYVQMKVR